MNKKQYQKQKEKRLLDTIQKFREFGILTEIELITLKEKKAWVIEYLENHRFITLANLTGDFMFSEWKIKLQGKKSGNSVLEMKRILIYSFRPIIQELVQKGKLLKYNTKTYKVVKE